MSEPAQSRIATRRSAAKSDGGADYAERRAELIRVAADVFRAKGYSAATLNDIATVFGTDRASLYYYVGSKRELFEECVISSTSDNLEVAQRIEASAISARQKLHDLIELLIESQVKHYPYQYVYIQENMQHAAEQDAAWAQGMVARTHDIEGIFLRVIQQGMDDGSFRSDLPKTLIANVVFGMTQWTHRWYVPDTSRYTAADIIRTFAGVLFEGIDDRS